MGKTRRVVVKYCRDDDSRGEEPLFAREDIENIRFKPSLGKYVGLAGHFRKHGEKLRYRIEREYDQYSRSVCKEVLLAVVNKDRLPFRAEVRGTGNTIDILYWKGGNSKGGVRRMIIIDWQIVTH